MKNKELDANVFMLSFNDNGSINSNYYQTEWNKKGCLCLALGKKNTFHLLVPESLEYMLSEMLTGRYAVLTTGISDSSHARSMGVDLPDNHEMIEIMFEDKSDSPFCSHIDARQFSYKLNSTFNRKKTILNIWTKKGCQIQMSLYIRCGKDFPIPYMKPCDTKTFITV